MENEGKRENIKTSILIKNSKKNIDLFKEKGVQYFTNEGKIYLFSYKNFLINILLNIEEYYKHKYKNILIATPEFIDFYKRKGININNETSVEEKDKLGFYIDNEYIILYYNLMHTFFLNECKNYSNYSISFYFDEIVNFINTREMELKIK